MIDKIIGLSRNTKRAIILLIDLMVLPLAFWIAMSLRLGEIFVPTGMRENVIHLFYIIPVIAIPIFIKLGLYRAIIRYVGLVAMWSIIQAVTIYSLLLGFIILLASLPGVPRSVLLINWLVTCLLIGGVRFAGRWLLARREAPRSRKQLKKRVAIYGAGNAGVQIAAALGNSPYYLPIAFIDDNLALQGNYIGGLRVISFGNLEGFIENHNITDVLVAMPSISRSVRSQIISKLEPYTVHVSTLPGMDDLASGKIKVDDVREVGVLDLLGRIPVKPDQRLLDANVKDKVVMVTGAGGSIGAELCRQILKIRPAGLVLFERSEHDLYAIEKELTELEKRYFPDEGSRITPILASILNQNRIESVCQAFNVQTIYHAAAYKHVPMVEKNPSEAVRNNVLGTYFAAKAAIASKVETFVLISTDKAVRPTNTMGATKRFAEMILQGLSSQPGTSTRFTMVRFGNVLASSGSVVPLFRDQIQKGGPVTVTDPRIIRYFMTIPEASQLVIQAGAMGKGGDVFVLDMGEPVKILDMARRLIHLSGLEIKDEDNPDGDIEIVYTGLRPGEKLYEELLIGDNVISTQHALIMSANEDSLLWDKVKYYIEQFELTIEAADVERSRSLLVEAVKGFNPQCDVVDLVQEQALQSKTLKKQSNILKYPS